MESALVQAVLVSVVALTLVAGVLVAIGWGQPRPAAPPVRDQPNDVDEWWILAGCWGFVIAVVVWALWERYGSQWLR